MFQGMDDANQRRLQDQSMQRQNRLADLAVSREERLQQGDQRQQLYGMAKGYLDYVTKNPQGGKQYYDTYLRPEFPKLGFGDPGDYDEAQTKNVAMQVVSAMGGGKASNPYDGLPSDIQSLQLLRDNPQLAAMDKERRQYSGMVPKLVETSQGIGWGTPGAGIKLAPLEGVAGQGATPHARPEAGQFFAALGQKYGIRPTSVGRTPQRNAEVGGVPNSYHLTGEASDWQVPAQYKGQFMADARANGYEAIDEGDHVHIEPAGQGGGAPGVAQPFQKPTAPSELDRRIDMARRLGATPDEIRKMVIGREGAAAGAKPIPVGSLNKILEAQDALGSTQVISDIIQKHAGRMQSGDLVVGPVGTLGTKLRTGLGMADAQDVNLNEWEADKTKIVNESLRLNKGVQTEGDAQRAVQELMGARDPGTAARALRRLAELNSRAVQLQKQKLNTIYSNYGRGIDGEPKQATQTQADNETSIDDLLDMYR